MKKTIVFSLMAASLMFSACSSDSNGIADDEPQKKKGMKLNAVVPENLTSRAAIGNTESNTWTFAFTNGDEAKVTNSNMSSYYTFTKSAEEFSSSEAEPTSTPANWYAYFPSTNIDLTAQSGNVADVANKFALAGKTSSATTGEDGLTIHMDAKVAVLVIDNQKGAIDINIKNSATTWVTGLSAKNGDATFDVTTSTTKTSILSKSENGKYYIVVPAGIQLAIKNGDEVIKSTVAEGLEAGKYYKIELKENKINGHEYVEIGGIKWATMNVGATTVAGSPATCYGDYFAWGETTPRYTGKTINSATSITFSGWKSGFPGGYESPYPTYTETTLDAAHDAARANWGSTWRTPTHEEYMALTKACTGSESNQSISSLSSPTPSGGVYWLSSTQSYLSEYTGISGILFVDKDDTSKKVFFPAAGYVNNTSFERGGSYGYSWSSLLITSSTNYASSLYFSSSYVSPSLSGFRCVGRTVRPVSD